MIVQLPTAESPVTLVRGDCLRVLAALLENSIDAILCDPPYELAFMGRSWDASGIAFNKLVWELALRALKPGGYLLAFGGTRTYHRLVVAIEDAGFEIRDSIHWIHRTGFPKSLSLSKAIDRHVTGERVAAGRGEAVDRGALDYGGSTGKAKNGLKAEWDDVPAVTDEAKAWAGWGTALKPAHEPIVLARKPMAGTVADNVLEHGTGGLNIDATRIAVEGKALHHGGSNPRSRGGVVGGDLGISGSTTEDFQRAQRESIERTNTLGRWPTNLVFSHLPPVLRDRFACADCGFVSHTVHDVCPCCLKGKLAPAMIAEGGCLDPGPCAEGCPVAELDAQSGASRSGAGAVKRRTAAEADGNGGAAFGAESRPAGTPMISYPDEGGASRSFPCFRFCAKPARSERDEGCDALPLRTPGEATFREDGSAGLNSPRAGAGRSSGSKNIHPTVKPVALLRWLAKLVTPPSGIVLDMFMGSGSTGVAAIREDFRYLGVELDRDAEGKPLGYMEIAQARIGAELEKMP
jgi:site-specific DNA-methyltransferase (adenine-specific)